MTNSKICLAGKNQIAVDCLNFLIRKNLHRNLIIVPNKTDTGHSNWQPSLLRFAREYNIAILSIEQVQEIEDLLFISLEFDTIIKPQDFKSSRLYNIHFSALPAFKGMYTSTLPILNHSAQSGVTLHKIDHGIDTGNIIAQRIFEISKEWTARDLYFAYMQYGFELFCSEFEKLIDIKPPIEFRQQSNGSTYFSKNSIDFNNLDINFRDTSFNIVQQLRAFSFREYQIPKYADMSIGNWEILPERSLLKPGTILSREDDSLIINTIDYNLRLIQFKEWSWFDLTANDSTLDLDPRFIDYADKMGWTPLIRAAFSGDYHLCEKLLRSGANPNKPNTNGTTPLMYAYSGINKNQIINTVKILIDFGADPNIRDKFNRDLNFYHSLES